MSKMPTIEAGIRGAASVDKPYLRAELAATGDRQWTLTVAPFGTLSEGRYIGIVELRPTQGGGEHIKPLRLPVDFEVLADVQADSTTVTFGTGTVGESRIQQVTLRSESGRAIRVERWIVDPAVSFSASLSKPQENNQVVDLHCRFQPGENTGRVRLMGSYADGSTFSVVLDMRSYGLPPGGKD